MRKHFLLVFLMALLPLMAWADGQEYDVTVVPSDASAVWCNGKPTVQAGWVIVQSETATKPTKLQVAEQIEIRDLSDGYGVGDHQYALQLKAGALGYVEIGEDKYYLHTNAQNTATLTITKATSTAEKNQLVYVTDPLTYDPTSTGQALLALENEGPEPAAATATANGVSVPVIYTLDPTATNVVTFANYAEVKATDAGTYTAYYKVAEDPNGNYSGTEWTELTGSKTIAPKSIGGDEPVLTVTFDPATPTYTGTAYTPTITVTDGEKPLTEGAATDETGDYTIAWDAEELLAAGNYTLTITGRGNYTGAQNVTYTIASVDDDLTVAFTGDYENGEVTYDRDEWKNRVTFSVKSGETDLTSESYDVVWKKGTAVVTSVKDAGTYTLNITGKGNYEGAEAEALTFVVNKKDLADGTFVAVADQEYTGSQIKPTPGLRITGQTFTDNILNYTYGENINAGVGAGTITVKVKSNASVAKNYTGSKTMTFNITKAELTATVKDQNIAFGAALPDNEIDGTSIQGLKGSDVFADVVGDITYSYKQGETDVQTPAAAGEYSIEASAEAANYNVTFTPGTLTISQSGVYIVPVAKFKKYGETDPALTWTVVDATSGETLNNNVLGGTVSLARTGSEDVGTYGIYVVSYTAAASDDYSVINTFGENGTKVASFTIFANTENTLKLKFTADAIANKSSKTYDGTTDVTFDADDLEIESGALNNDTWDAIKATATIAAELSDANVGDGITANVTVTGLTNYPVVEVTPMSYTIDPREITITANDQTIAQGSSIDQNEFVVSENVTAYGDVVADLNIELTATETAVGVYDEGITVTAQNANYDFEFVAGKLTIIDNTALELRSVYADADDDEFTKLLALDEQTVNVKITVNRTQTLASGKKYTWKGEDWNAFILPFDITPKDLSEAFGYAIVNVVNPSATTADNIAFKLQMSGTIPANTPFMLKNYEAVAENAVIDFGARKIVAPESEEVLVDAGAVWTFIGSYKTKTIDNNNTNVYYYNGEGAWKHLGATSSNTWNIAPFNAYMLQSVAAPTRGEITFTFEEPNGNKTAIKSISEDATNTNIEGWYNLNGMKMDGAPLQKGVYIKDGKKVVIK